jgi:hypothetical protein
LLDDYETGTGVYVSIFDTGTDSLLFDSDGDIFSDSFEILAGTDPNNPASFPGAGEGPTVPSLWGWGPGVLSLALVGAGAFAIRKRRVAR